MLNEMMPRYSMKDGTNRQAIYRMKNNTVLSHIPKVCFIALRVRNLLCLVLVSFTAI